MKVKNQSNDKNMAIGLMIFLHLSIC